MIKKRYGLILLMLLAFAWAGTAYAANTPGVIVDGDAVDFTDAEPMVSDAQRILVPLRFVSNALDADVNWNDATKVVTVKDATRTIVLPVDVLSVTVNGKTQEMDTPAVIDKGRVYVPLRFISEYLGADVQWDGKRYTAVIESAEYHKLDDYTLLVYMNGTDLESTLDEETGLLFGAASLDLEEMMAVGAGAGINVLVETGGTKQWAIENIDPNLNQRFYADRGRLILQESVPQSNMGAPETLAAFIEWGMKKYPAKKTGLIMWNHGGGPIYGYGVDEWFDSDALTLPELDKALKKALPGEDKLSFIGFDACLMASVETANALTPYADYLLASQELEPQGGWDYSGVVSAIIDYPYYETEGMLKLIADGFKVHSIVGGVGEDVTLSVVKLDQMAAVNTAAGNLFKAMGQNLSNKDALIAISSAVAKTKAYGGNTTDQGYTNLYDVVGFASNLPSTYSAQVNALKDAVNRAVRYKVSGPINASASGLSVFLPYYGLDDIKYSLDIHKQLPLPNAQLAFVSAFPSILQSSGIGEGMENSFTVTEPTDDKPFYTLNVDKDHRDMVEGVYLNLLQYVEKGGARYRLLGYDTLVENKGNGVYEEAFNGAWTTFGGHPVAMQVVNETDAFVEYEIPLMINDKRMTLLAAWYYDKSLDAGGYYKILGARAGIDADTNMPDRKIIQLKKGDVIQPIYLSVYLDKEEVVEELGDAFTLGADFGLTFSQLSDKTGGSYALQFLISDYAGNTYTTDAYDFTLE